MPKQLCGGWLEQNNVAAHSNFQLQFPKLSKNLQSQKLVDKSLLTSEIRPADQSYSASLHCFPQKQCLKLIVSSSAPRWASRVRERGRKWSLTASTRTETGSWPWMSLSTATSWWWWTLEKYLALKRIVGVQLNELTRWTRLIIRVQLAVNFGPDRTTFVSVARVTNLDKNCIRNSATEGLIYMTRSCKVFGHKVHYIVSPTMNSDIAVVIPPITRFIYSEIIFTNYQ